MWWPFSLFLLFFFFHVFSLFSLLFSPCFRFLLFLKCVHLCFSFSPFSPFSPCSFCSVFSNFSFCPCFPFFPFRLSLFPLSLLSLICLFFISFFSLFPFPLYSCGFLFFFLKIFEKHLCTSAHVRPRKPVGDHHRLSSFGAPVLARWTAPYVPSSVQAAASDEICGGVGSTDSWFRRTRASALELSGCKRVRAPKGQRNLSAPSG